MKKVVVPEMAPFLAAGSSDFSCVNCHGQGAKSGKFHMPPPDITPLDPRDHYQAARKAHPEETRWMEEKVLPAMARLLGEPVQSDQSPDGFSCMGCHPHSKP